MSHIALSYSRLNQFELCPLKFEALYITKTYPDEGDNYFFKKGKRLHEQAENVALCQLSSAVHELQYDAPVKNVIPIIKAICASHSIVKTELQLAVDKDFKPCSWFDKSTYFRAIVDLLGVESALATIIDHKSGKVREYDNKITGQLHLCAAMIFAHYPEVEDANTAYLFMEHKQTIKKSFTSDEDLQTPFFEAFETVNTCEKFEPKRNQYCGYCLLEECQFKSLR